MSKEDSFDLKWAILLYSSIGMLCFISWYNQDLFVTISCVLLSIGIIAVGLAFLYNLI